MSYTILPFQWIVEAKGGFRQVPIVDQNMTQTADGAPPEDAVRACGAAALCSLAKWQHHEILLPDEVKDRILGQNAVGPTSADQLQAFLKTQVGLPNTRMQPTSQSAYNSAVYNYLRQGKVLLNLVWFETVDTRDANGAPILHWRVIVAQTDMQQVSTDSQKVDFIAEDYLQAWKMAQGAVTAYGTPMLIGIDRLPDVN